MIRIILILFICSLSPINVYTQRNIYPNYTQEPTFVPDALHRLYIVGLQNLNSGELTQAEIAFRSIVAFPSGHEDWRTIRYYKGKAHVYLGDIYFVQKKYDRAVQQYKSVAKEYAEIEEYSMAVYKLGRALILDKQEIEGIEVLTDYNFNYGTTDRAADNALYWIAQGYIGLQNYTSALQILYQILRDFPSSPMAYDVRVLATKLETSISSPIPKNTLASEQESSKNKITALSEEKELVDRIKDVLILKEHLLHLKEKKLELLESLGKTRAKALKDKNITVLN